VLGHASTAVKEDSEMATYNPTNTGMGTTGMGTGTTGTQTTHPTTSTSSMGRDAKDTLERATDTVAEKAGGVTTAIGERLERAGDFLEEKGKAAFLSERLQGAGKYMQDNDARQMARSVDSAICAHPYRGILIGLGVGWVVGKFLSRD
jgi:ElaB/YqjD/DUF883 family membrane-anchored ribosome-binding protein